MKEGPVGAGEELAEMLSSGKRVLFIGLGNPYRSDDAFGPALLDALLERDATEKFPNTVFIFAERNLLDAVPIIEEEEPRTIILADSAQMEKEPGTVLLAEYGSYEGAPLSTHENNYPMFATFVEDAVPGCKIMLLLVQWGSVEMSDEEELTPSVKKALQELLTHFSA